MSEMLIKYLDTYRDKVAEYYEKSIEYHKHDYKLVEVITEDLKNLSEADYETLACYAITAGTNRYIDFLENLANGLH